MSAIEERRGRAIHALMRPHPNGNTGIVEAIEVATQVRITDEAIEAFGEAWHARQMSGKARTPGDRRRAGLAAALEVLGFEVVE